jgi:hypothetical protein
MALQVPNRREGCVMDGRGCYSQLKVCLDAFVIGFPKIEFLLFVVFLLSETV